MATVADDDQLGGAGGIDERTQARNLFDHAAHPRVRDELREEAAELGLL